MAAFDKETLEGYKYADLVKVAKEHEVYRRYAPKAELVEKLLALNELEVETLSDVSMPSFMEDDDEQDTENAMPQETSKSNVKRGRKAQKKDPLPSSRSPLSDNDKNENVRIDCPVIVKNISGTPQPLRRSLAGPAIMSKPKLITKGRKLKPQAAVDKGSNEEKSVQAVQSPARRLTRQRTYDADPPTVDKGSGNLTLKRQRTYDVDIPDSDSHSLKRQGTFDIEQANTEGKAAHEVPSLRSRKLKREGTFEVDKNVQEVEGLSNNVHTRKLKREGTFDVEISSTSKDSTTTSEAKTTDAILKSTSKPRLSRRSQVKEQRQSLRPSGRFSTGTGSSKADMKTANEKSAPHRFFTSRARPIEIMSSGAKTSASKTKTPSVLNEIQRKKAEVSAKKIVDASEKVAVSKKAPDFNAIHKRLFGKMESLVDSKRKVVDRANSLQKSQLKFGKRSPAGPANSKVVRKLISPKAGKSKLLSPKPVFQQVASTFASNVVAIQGVSKLQSPRLFSAKPTSNGAAGGPSNRFGFTKGPELQRKDVLKASVMERKPVKRGSPMAKAKQMLQTVRLNKRFELQMKHRIAQQSSK